MLKYFFKVSDKISAKFVKNILCRKIYLFIVQSFHRELMNYSERLSWGGQQAGKTDYYKGV